MVTLTIWTIIGWTASGVIALLLLLFLISNIKLRNVQHRQKDGLKEIFTRHNLNTPQLKFGSRYWWPTFTISFDSQTEYMKAKDRGIFEEFEKLISGFYDTEFDPKMAVTFTYPGQTI